MNQNHDSDVLFDLVVEGVESLRATVEVPVAVELLGRMISSVVPIEHFSIWGRDAINQRAFFTHQIWPANGAVSGIPMTYRFGETIIGRSVEQQQDAFGSLEQSGLDADKLLPAVSHGVALGSLYCSCIFSASIQSLPSSSLLVMKQDIRLARKINSAIRNLVSTFLAVCARQRTARFQKLMHTVNQAKTTRSGLAFISAVSADIAKTFDATSFSVWVLEGNKLVSKHFSEPHDKAGMYELGEGITGSVAQKGEPIFLHVLTDAEARYDVKWVAKVSDFAGESANENDHVMVLPLSYSERGGVKPRTQGVVRFVSRATCPSFWPIDFERALSVAETVSVLLFQEQLLNEEKSTSAVLKNLLTLGHKARRLASLRDISEEFQLEMLSWPDVVNVAILTPHRGDYREEDFPEFARRYFNAALTKRLRNFEHVEKLDSSIHIWPLRYQEVQFGMLFVALRPSDRDLTTSWIHLASLLLGSIYASDTLLEQTKQLRQNLEEKEMSALAGAISRQYAHEVMNGIKAARSWIENQHRKKEPDFQGLNRRLNDMHENVSILLNSTGFLKVQPRDCVLNTELERVLETCGYRNGQMVENCTIKLAVTGHKHRIVHMDPNSLIAIVRNLVLNAVEQYAVARRSGPIEIGVFEELLADKLYVGFYVKDYAIGVASEIQNLIWNSGFTTKEQGGKGLGLSIVKRLVEESDGIVALDSVFGRYATFRVKYKIVES